MKVSKGAKIRNQYNQVPHLTQDTNWKVINLQLDRTHESQEGAQWLSGRALDSRPKGRGFEPHRRHCAVVLEQDTFILA